MSTEHSWRPTASFERLRDRARLLQDVREFFCNAGVLEVETPVISGYAATDPALHGFITRCDGPASAGGGRCFLQSSPEFPMKRLLAAGSGPIFQVCKVFRNGEYGRHHNPEFTLLEWYRPGFDPFSLMEEVADLVRSVLRSGKPPPPVQHLTYAEAFETALGIDPHTADTAALQGSARRAGIQGAGSLVLDDRDAWLDLLLSHCIQPDLGRGCMTFLHDYPASQAALARVRQGPPPVAERFELFLEGMEIANGYHELTDAVEQRRRFEAELAERERRGQPRVPLDPRFLSALTEGMPDAAGVALGIDRLLMFLTGAGHIREVLAFPVDLA